MVTVVRLGIDSRPEPVVCVAGISQFTEVFDLGKKLRLGSPCPCRVLVLRKKERPLLSMAIPEGLMLQNSFV